jgi:MinD-like ATPase involved in chromosome partitioning or flagellar assembly
VTRARTRIALLVQDGTWAESLEGVAEGSREFVLVRRCDDLEDLLAAVVLGLADVAVVDATVEGLDADAVRRLRGRGVRLLCLASGVDVQERSSRIGADLVLDPDLVVAAWESTLRGLASGPGPTVGAPSGSGGGSGGGSEVVAIWGPQGAPGRTTVAVALAMASARSGVETLLLDVDPYGGAVAQHLGIEDELSGLLLAARAANAGTLTTARLEEVAVGVRPGLRALTGLTRPERWIEVRPAMVSVVLEVAAETAGRIVVDAGFDLDQSLDRIGSSTPRRNDATLIALERADRVVAVGGADAVSLARLLRGLTHLLPLVEDRHVDVVVNRFRPGLGWVVEQVRALIQEVVPGARILFVPDDVESADAALLQAISPLETPSGALPEALVSATAVLLGTQRPSLRRRSWIRR